MTRQRQLLHQSLGGLLVYLTARALTDWTDFADGLFLVAGTIALIVSMVGISNLYALADIQAKAISDALDRIDRKDRPE